ncbi:hypothetical protein RND71_022074 [Anisodus tanguticus]|uniref:Uncharacterized protein n=1 Tax=Anisodus tanguticus TaxID=243964 RepID=A0AAE1VGR5_9SOLA|nr:hypothetical protein RND71_022074 [Anisodus tanguticus]
MGGSSVAPLGRTSSIENEPRTLNLNQIQFARDAALYIINTRDLEEAMRIFTKGLKPVVGCVHDKEEYAAAEDLDGLSNPYSRIRDIATAPF